ncbi:hypothetical protein PVAP13_6KG007100 [Panicum virgatum]|uniref:Uncharacterized protein n=1 Tax=Panicum virgatum TaxID=38727 RepID=A0A8T0R5U2_PANVG|nr:hypothetical protein PVAP13_6KG007100 [Panicum virgatum]
MLVKKRPGALIITLERTTGVQNRIAVCSPKLWSLVRSELYASSTEISRYRSQSVSCLRSVFFFALDRWCAATR